MRKSMIFLAALAAILAPAMASAQTQKPDPFVIEDNSLMGRYPRLPEDRLVAADTGGELAGVRGKAWWQVLMHCAGVYRFHHNELTDAGDTASAAETETIGKAFIGLAIDRLVADRKISIDDTVAILIPEANYSLAGAADGGEEHRPFKVDEMRCRDVERLYTAASKGW
jgi:CubicO group peptidase (beta-lactamase class C family)